MRTIVIFKILDPYLVTGFPCVIIDGSNINAHIIADILSVTTVLSCEGEGSTTVVLANARYADETDWINAAMNIDGMTTGAEPTLVTPVVYDEVAMNFTGQNILEPSIPPWLSVTGNPSKQKWGVFEKDVEPVTKPDGTIIYNNDGSIKQKLGANTFKQLKPLYTKLLGSNGGEPITEWEANGDPSRNPNKTIKKAIDIIKQDYISWQQAGNTEHNVNVFKRRNLITIDEAFGFVGASSGTTNVTGADDVPEAYTGDNYMRLLGITSEDLTAPNAPVIFGKSNYAVEQNIMDIKKQVVVAYKQSLLASDGFRG